MSKLYGVIGYPLSHSFSPTYFNNKFSRQKIDATYKAFELSSIDHLPELLKKNPSLLGFNVTVPYKQDIIQHLDALSKEAAEINAVNCVDIQDGLLKGYNTDVIGFEKTLTPLLKSYNSKAIILGNGGAASAVKYVLQKLKIEFLVASRKDSFKTISYGNLSNDLLKEHTVIINTTPLGMYPKVADGPQINYAVLGKQHLLYDLIYNPEETQFLSEGKKQGAAIKNGFEMLKIQAEESWKIWNR